MIIDNIPYVGMSESISCSVSASLAMLLSFYNIRKDPQDLFDLFEKTFLGDPFREWYMHSLDVRKQEESITLACASYLISTKFAPLRASVVESSLSFVRLSYLKRKIPALISGRFPLFSGRVANTVLLKGYVGDEFYIVNDPRGNANSLYLDHFGENMIYSVDNLRSWAEQDGKLYVLRVLTD